MWWWIIGGWIVLCIIGKAAEDANKSKSSENLTNDTNDSFRNMSHSWQYTGRNESAVARGDPYPNSYYLCSKCGANGIDRGSGIETDRYFCKKS
jgi:hypothetical protein